MSVAGLTPTGAPSLQPGLSVVVPVYCGEATLSQLVERLSATLQSQAFPHFEVILVNDGSPDCSWETVQNLAARYPWVSGINLMRNYGQHNALLCGIRAARCQTIVTMDDDLQHPPEEIASLMAKLNEGYDVVYGSPLRQQHGWLRNLASGISKWVLRGAMGAETASKVSAFRVFRTQLREAFVHYGGSFVSIDVLLTWGTRRFGAVTVRHDPRAAGESGYTLRKLTLHGLNMMTGFSALPLQFASLMGFAFTLFGLAVLAFVLGRYFLQGNSVPGFPFLASVIAIFSGAQLFALGIIGEYLARMHFRMMEKPAYTVRSIAGGTN